MERASVDFWENYLETMLFLKHTVKQRLVSISTCTGGPLPLRMAKLASCGIAIFSRCPNCCLISVCSTTDSAKPPTRNISSMSTVHQSINQSINLCATIGKSTHTQTSYTQTTETSRITNIEKNKRNIHEHVLLMQCTMQSVAAKALLCV